MAKRRRIWKSDIPPNSKKYYRYELVIDQDYYEYYTSTRKVLVECKEYYRVKDIPKGFSVASGRYGRMHFILNKAKKKFAREDKKEALKDFYLRKLSDLKLLEQRISDVKHALVVTENRLLDYYHHDDKIQRFVVNERFENITY